MHRLVQDFTRRAMTEERRGEALREALGWVNGAFVGDPSDVRSWPVLDPLAPHALAVAPRADEGGIAEPTGRLFHEVGFLLSAKARFAEAEPLRRRALAIFEENLGTDHPRVATALNSLDSLALLLQHTNRPGEAKSFFRRALAIDEAHYGPDHPVVAIPLNNLAVLLRNTKSRRRGGAAHSSRASDRRGERWAQSPQCRDPSQQSRDPAQGHEPRRRGGALIRRALSINEASYGPDHPDVSITLNNLANLLRMTNRPAEVEALVRRALKIDEASYGPDHPAVARDLANLATVLVDADRLSDAEPLFGRALAILEKSLGADHPNTVTVRKNLAALEAKRTRPT